MELNKLFMAMTAVTTMTLVACGGDDSSSSSSTTETGVACSVGTGVEVMKNDGTNETIVVDVAEPNGKPICALSGVISEDVTLTTDYVYSLVNYVTVGDGKGASQVVEGRHRAVVGSAERWSKGGIPGTSGGRSGHVTISARGGRFFSCNAFPSSPSAPR